MKSQKKDRDIIYVRSTGSYATNEYVEALFGVREESGVRHIAKVVYKGGNE